MVASRKACEPAVPACCLSTLFERTQPACCIAPGTYSGCVTTGHKGMGIQSLGRESRQVVKCDETHVPFRTEASRSVCPVRRRLCTRAPSITSGHGAQRAYKPVLTVATKQTGAHLCSQSHRLWQISGAVRTRLQDYTAAVRQRQGTLGVAKVCAGNG